MTDNTNCFSELIANILFSHLVMASTQTTFQPTAKGYSLRFGGSCPALH